MFKRRIGNLIVLKQDWKWYCIYGVPYFWGLGHPSLGWSYHFKWEETDWSIRVKSIDVWLKWTYTLQIFSFHFLNKSPCFFHSLPTTLKITNRWVFKTLPTLFKKGEPNALWGTVLSQVKGKRKFKFQFCRIFYITILKFLANLLIIIHWKFNFLERPKQIRNDITNILHVNPSNTIRTY